MPDLKDPVFRLPRARISYGILAHALKTLQSGKPYTKPKSNLIDSLRFCELQPEEIDTVLNAIYHGTNREEAQKILIHALDELRMFVEHHICLMDTPESEVRELMENIKNTN